MPRSQKSTTSARRGTYFGTYASPQHGSSSRSPKLQPSPLSLKNSPTMAQKETSIISPDTRTASAPINEITPFSLEADDSMQSRPPSSFYTNRDHSTNQHPPNDSSMHSSSSKTSLKQQAYSLQNRLVQLSLEIEDSDKSVNLLKSKLRQMEKSADSEQREIGDRWREEFKKQSHDLQKDSSASLNVVDELTMKKKSLALAVTELQRSIKEEEERTNKLVEKVKKKSEQEIEAACANWGEGEAIRREKWLERKTKEIREITIKGLEPEVQRIIDKHKVDCAELDNEYEQNKQDYLVEFYADLDVKKEDFEKKQLKKYNNTLTTTRAAGNERLSEVQEEHSQNLMKLRKRLASEGDSQRKWQNDELKRLAENHSDEMANIRIIEAKRLTEMRRRWVEEKDSAERQFKSAVDEIAENQAIINEQWETKIKNKLQKESLDKISEERTRLRTSRDHEIEIKIRSLQSSVVEAEKNFKQNLEIKANGLKREHDSDVAGMIDKKARWGEKLNKMTEQITANKEEKRRQEETLKALETYIVSVDEEIAKVITDSEKLKGEMVVEVDRSGRMSTDEMSSLGAKKKDLELSVVDLRKKIEMMNSKHERLMEKIAREHETELNEIERRVKRILGEKAGITQTLEGNIQKEIMKIDHAKKMVASYLKRREEKGEEKAKEKEGGPNKNKTLIL